MSPSVNVIEYSAEQYRAPCWSIFSQPDSFHLLTESEDGLAHHGPDDLERSYLLGCPFRAFLVDDVRTLISRGWAMQEGVLAPER